MSIDIAPPIAPIVGEALGERASAIRAEVGVARNEAGIRAVRTQLTGGN